MGPGDVVLVRDCARKSKFDPKFLPDPFVVVRLDEVAKKVILEGLRVQKMVVRHLDDVKIFHGDLDLSEDQAGLVGEMQLPEDVAQDRRC